VIALLGDETLEVRAAAVLAIGELIGGLATPREECIEGGGGDGHCAQMPTVSEGDAIQDAVRDGIRDCGIANVPQLTDMVRQLQLSSRLLAVLSDASPLVRTELVVALSVQICAQHELFTELVLSPADLSTPEPTPSPQTPPRSTGDGENPLARLGVSRSQRSSLRRDEHADGALSDDLLELSLDLSDSMDSPPERRAAIDERLPAAADAHALHGLGQRLGSALLKALAVLQEDPCPNIQRMATCLLMQFGASPAPQRSLSLPSKLHSLSPGDERAPLHATGEVGDADGRRSSARLPITSRRGGPPNLNEPTQAESAPDHRCGASNGKAVHSSRQASVGAATEPMPDMSLPFVSQLFEHSASELITNEHFYAMSALSSEPVDAAR
jgi:hypothetical protein